LRRRPGGIAFSGRAQPQQAHLAAAVGQKPGGDIAVPAVIAGPGDDRHRRPRGIIPADMVGDRPAGIFHQVGTGNTARDRQPIGLRHFRIGQKFDHAGTVTSGRVTDNAARLARKGPRPGLGN
jgi:hypothetical protein